MQQIVAVYKDYGCSMTSPTAIFNWLRVFLSRDVPVVYVSADDILGRNPNGVLGKEGLVFGGNTLALFFPGGHSRGYSDEDKLGANNNAGLKRVCDFVKAGGLVSGICGGAYFLSAKTIFRGEHLEITKTAEHFLFDGVAKGAIPELTNGHLYNGENYHASNVVEVSYNDSISSRKALVCYHGGACFLANDEISDPTGVEILGRYVKTNTPAIVKVLHGRGVAILSGVHPEYYTGSEIPRIKHSQDYDHCLGMYDILQKNMATSETFSRFLLSQLGLPLMAVDTRMPDYRLRKEPAIVTHTGC